MATVKLYYDPISPPARACLWLCKMNDPEGKEVECIYTKLAKGEHLTPEFLAMNPYHTVPTMKDESNGLSLYESGAILQYLCEKFPHWTVASIPSMEKDAITRFKAINYLHFNHIRIRKDLGQAFYARCGHLFGKGDGVDHEAIKKTIEAAKPMFEKFDKMIADNGGYVAGSYPTAADLQCYGEIGYFLTSKYGLDIYNFKPYANITAWFAKMKELPKYEEVLETVVEFVNIANNAAPSSCCDEQ